MGTKTRLEDLFSIDDDNYTTGSESVDGLLIGLAAWLLIRSSEFIALDLLTLFYGNRKHRTGYRVLRIWQLLNICHFYKLFTGVDTDLPFRRFRKAQSEQGFHRNTLSGLRVRKGRFMPLLVLSVSLAKILVLVAEVAIIAFVIPVSTVHRSNGGLGLTWTNTTVTLRSLSELTKCEQVLVSSQFTETAQLGLCKRVSALQSIKPVPLKWIPNGALRLEYIDYSPENMRRAGAIPVGSGWQCRIPNSSIPLRGERMYSKSMARQRSFGAEPSVTLINDLNRGELAVVGNSIKTEDAISGEVSFQGASAAVLPIFTEAKGMLRLSFIQMFNDMSLRGRRKVLTLNGKLLIGSPTAQLPGAIDETVCHDALDEIIRVTGSLHPGLIIDVLRSGMTVFATENFTEPSQDSNNLRTTNKFAIGASRKFRIPPEWMVLAAGLAVLTSALTSRLNKTEVNMARVYREHNGMYSACAPSYLEEELVVEGTLFQNGNEYHWGLNPGKSWDQVTSIDRSEEGALV